MKTIDKSQISNNFLEVLEQIKLEGEAIVVTEDNKPILKISPYQKASTTAKLFAEIERKSSIF
ncbi:hypothetical protein [Geitlerinema sp. P-1104]|uniref:type II toxin-antitoxin system Phd/YefM family antitoxin n=1 Tax=Geitlerinema sp. P-1104 TaxID=2546230 RepID=UPI00197D9789|nr:hypothetical protein [Geitlerinema sp. P-1104]